MVGVVKTVCGLLVNLDINTSYIRRKPFDLNNFLSGHVSPFWRGVLNVSKAIASGIKIEVGNGCSTRCWVDYWVDNDAVVSTFPNLFMLAVDPFTTVVYWMENLFGLPNLEDDHPKLSNELNNLLALFQPKNLSNTIPDVRQWKLKQNGLFTVNSL